MRAHQVVTVRYTERFDEMVWFYRDQMAWPILRQWDRAQDDRGTVFTPVSGEACAVEVLTLGDTAVSDAGPPVNVAMSVEVTDTDGVMADLKRSGVSIAREMIDNPWGHRSFGVDDPDGLRIWIYHVFEVEEDVDD